MFVSAFLSFVLYLLIFFRLRGNIVPKGWRLKFQKRRIFPSQAETTDGSIIAVAKMMLLYPVSIVTREFWSTSLTFDEIAQTRLRTRL